MSPRLLVLALVVQQIQAQEYVAALEICRRHRLDLNVLVDFNPQAFIKSFSPSWFAVFLRQDQLQSPRQTLSIHHQLTSVDVAVKQADEIQQENGAAYSGEGKLTWCVRSLCAQFKSWIQMGRIRSRFAASFLTSAVKQSPPRFDEHSKLLTKRKVITRPLHHRLGRLQACYQASYYADRRGQFVLGSVGVRYDQAEKSKLHGIALDLVTQGELYDEALEVFPAKRFVSQSDRESGNNFETEGRVPGRGEEVRGCSLCLFGGIRERKARGSFIAAHKWQMALALSARDQPQQTPERSQQQDGAVDDILAVSRIYVEYCNDIDEAVALLVTHQQWAEALRMLTCISVMIWWRAIVNLACCNVATMSRRSWNKEKHYVTALEASDYNS
ncbi:IKI3 protein [Phytophthora cactorum]|nr:IKI3 protein [Phytophthora cactorum]